MLIDIFYNKKRNKDAKKIAKIFEDNFIEVRHNICATVDEDFIKRSFNNFL